MSERAESSIQPRKGVGMRADVIRSRSGLGGTSGEVWRRHLGGKAGVGVDARIRGPCVESIHDIGESVVGIGVLEKPRSSGRLRTSKFRARTRAKARSKEDGAKVLFLLLELERMHMHLFLQVGAFRLARPRALSAHTRRLMP